MSYESVASFEREWSSARKLSLELLSSLNQDDLQFSPGAELGPFWKQFRHLGRVQECYLQAIQSGAMKFTPEGSIYPMDESKEAVRAYLTGLDQQMKELLVTVSPSAPIEWPGERISVLDHLLRLLSHEMLHQGQWVVYMSLMGKAFPKCWEIWGL